MPGQRDCQEFADVVDTNYKRIFRGALSLTGDRRLAEEIVQETFILAFKKFDSFSGRASAFTWLYGIMLNKYRDHCRRRGCFRGWDLCERMPIPRKPEIRKLYSLPWPTDSQTTTRASC